MHARSPESLALVAALALVACGGEGVDVSSSAIRPATAPPATSMAGGNKVLPVMTRNLYLGADLTPVIDAQTPTQFVAATTAVWTMVNVNDFSVRVEAIADEIAREGAVLIGVQEAYLWRIQEEGDAAVGGTTPATTVVYDYVQLLLDALRARGLEYRAAATVTLFDFEAPIATGEDVRLTDRGVILAREDVATRNPVEQVFETLLPLTVLGQAIEVQRGWVSVDVKYRGEQLRFVSTHLEAFEPRVRLAQGVELATVLAAETRPTILVGDLNSTVDEVVQAAPPPAEPVPGARAVLGGIGFQDAWTAPDEEGLTCCFPEDLRVVPAEPPAFDTRIDYVLYRGLFEVRDVEVIGEEAGERVSGLWPSDHAGVVATLRILDPRFTN